MLANQQILPNTTNDSVNKYPTSIFENLLQNTDLLEALFKPINNETGENSSNNSITTTTTINELIDDQQSIFDDIFGSSKKKIEEADDTSKIYGNPFVGPNLWNKEELFSCDKLGLQFEFLDTEDFLAENADALNATDISFLQNTTTTTTTNTTATTATTAVTTQSKENAVETKAAQKQIMKNIDDIIPDDILMDISSPSASTSTSASNASKKRKTRKQSSVSSNSLITEDDLSQLSPEELLEKVERLVTDDEMDEFDESIKGSKKRTIPEELKDEKYWNRRRQNNLAAKRSRDARRLKESEVALKASFLERENMILKRQLEEYKQETKVLKIKLARYERKKN